MAYRSKSGLGAATIAAATAQRATTLKLKARITNILLFAASRTRISVWRFRPLFLILAMLVSGHLRASRIEM
jgi:hypothetical protein